MQRLRTTVIYICPLTPSLCYELRLQWVPNPCLDPYLRRADLVYGTGRLFFPRVSGEDILPRLREMSFPISSFPRSLSRQTSLLSPDLYPVRSDRTTTKGSTL